MTPKFVLTETPDPWASNAGWRWFMTDATGDVIATSPPADRWVPLLEAREQIALVRRLAADAEVEEVEA